MGFEEACFVGDGEVCHGAIGCDGVEFIVAQGPVDAPLSLLPTWPWGFWR